MNASKATVALMLLFAATGMAQQCNPLASYLKFYNKQYSFIAAAFEAIPSLEDFSKIDMEPAEPFTILLPTDTTIRTFLPVLNITAEDLMADTTLLEAVLRSHIILGALPADVKDGSEFATALQSQLLKVSRLEDDVCFSAWSYACINGKQQDVCQGKVVQVNSVIIPDSLEAGEEVVGSALSNVAIAG